MANIQKGDSLASDSVTECYVGTVTHFRNESRKERNSSNVNAGDKQQAEQVQTGPKQETKSFSQSLNIDTNLNEANDPTPSREEVKEEKKETPIVEEIKTKDLKSENMDEDIRRSFFSPMKFVRFPSMFGDEKFEKQSLFKDENVIKVNFE